MDDYFHIYDVDEVLYNDTFDILKEKWPSQMTPLDVRAKNAIHYYVVNGLNCFTKKDKTFLTDYIHKNRKYVD